MGCSWRTTCSGGFFPSLLLSSTPSQTRSPRHEWISYQSRIWDRVFAVDIKWIDDNPRFKGHIGYEWAKYESCEIMSDKVCNYNSARYYYEYSDWYRQRLTYPWIFKALNPLLSSMGGESWEFLKLVFFRLGFSLWTWFQEIFLRFSLR